MFSRKLACSFCGRSEADVEKLVAGPKVYICDRCAVEVIRIMETSHDNPTPSAESLRGALRQTWNRLLLRIWFRLTRVARERRGRSCFAH
jgi:hypothetical protein